MKIPRILSILGILLLLPFAFLAAQEDAPHAEILFYDFPGFQIEDEGGFDITEGAQIFDIGSRIEIGWTIKTNDTSLELQLVPNGSIMKLAPNTEFTIANLSPTRNSGNNDFVAAAGRVRTVAARLGSSAQMRIRSGSTLAGVRGTDFSFDADNGKLFVTEGLVNFAKLTGDGFDAIGESLDLAAGQFADAFADVFEAAAFSPEDFAAQFGELVNFQAADPAAVPDTPEDETPAEEPEEEVSEEEGDDEGGSGEPVVVEQPSDEGGAEGDSEEPSAPDEDDLIMQALGFLGMEIGSVTIDGDTYSKVVFQPEFNFGKLRGQLYLPIVYTSNFMDPDDWYRPNGNDEWSFGTDQTDTLPMIADALTDTVLKFKYLQWGDIRDPFFFQLGNVSSMTLGHGILIRGYANDADFPAVRRIGLNLGITPGNMRIQTLVNDIADPYLYGLRVQFGLRGGMGISLAGDFSPAEDLASIDSPNTAQANALEADPVFLNAALDFDIPIMENNVLGLVFFADAATFLPYLRNGVGGLDPGFQFQSIYSGDTGFRNYGIEAGAFGNVLFIDYRVQFQYYTGSFKPGFYSQPYDRIRGERAVDTVSALISPPAETEPTMGIFGSGGANLLDEKLVISLGYLWPWTLLSDGTIGTEADDYFSFGLQVDKELLSFLPWEMEAGLQYDRLRFRDAVTGRNNARFFDASATLKGEAVVAIAPGINLAITLSNNVLRDENGNIRYDENGNAQIGPSIGLETRIGN